MTSRPSNLLATTPNLASSVLNMDVAFGTAADFPSSTASVASCTSFELSETLATVVPGGSMSASALAIVGADGKLWSATMVQEDEGDGDDHWALVPKVGLTNIR